METKTGELLTENIAGVNRILPHKHKYAWDLFLKSCANNWMPTEISMQNDIKQWKNDEITQDEKLLVKRCLGFFAGSESLVGNNLLLSAFRYVTDAECRQYILRQAFEESLHNLTVVYICDSLDLDIEEVFAAYETIPSIKAKDDFLMQITNDISAQDFNPNTKQGKQEILRNFLTYWIVCEGTFFFSGFAMLLALGRQNKLQGVSDQIKYQRRQKRGGGQVRGHSFFLEENRDRLNELPDPSSDFAEEFGLVCRERLTSLRSDLRQVAIWKMEGYSNKEIAGLLGCVEESVRRKVILIRSQWTDVDE